MMSEDAMYTFVLWPLACIRDMRGTHCPILLTIGYRVSVSSWIVKITKTKEKNTVRSRARNEIEA